MPTDSHFKGLLSRPPVNKSATRVRQQVSNLLKLIIQKSPDKGEVAEAGRLLGLVRARK